MHIITATGQFQLPYPPAPSLFGAVHIHPEGSIGRAERHCIDEYAFAYFILEADPFPESKRGSLPSDFRTATLRWAARSATLIVPWAGGVPFDREHFTRLLGRHVRDGGRILLALIRDADHDEWLRHLIELSRKDAEFLSVREQPSLPGLPVGIKHQNCPTSGAVH